MSTNDHGTEPANRADDQTIIDRIATVLATSDDWDADVVNEVAILIGVVRPDPGVDEDGVDQWVDDFRAATGREIEPYFDRREQ